MPVGGLSMLQPAAARSPIMTGTTNFPHLGAALGDSLLDVQQRSTYPVRVDDVRDDDLFVVERSVQFAFAGPGPFAVAPTRFVALNSTAALVIAIESGAHLDYLAAENALALADELATRIGQAGWMADGAKPNVTGRAEL